MLYKNVKIEDVLTSLRTNPRTGLTQGLIKERLEKYGYNEISQKKNFSVLGIFIRQFYDFLTLILIISTLLAFFVGKIPTAIAIILVVIANIILGFTMEYKSEKSLEALKKMIKDKTRVIRDEKEQMIDSALIVPGDIIVIEEGQQIPADARIIEEINLKVDQSALTGESAPVQKDLLDTKGDRADSLFLGTTAVTGHGKAVVITTGEETEFGKIAKSLSEIKEPPTPLQKQVIRLSKLIVLIGSVLAGLILLLGLFEGKSILSHQQLIMALSIFVSVVPAGLLVVMTLTLATGVHRMAKEKAIIKKLNSVETLGSTQVICTDKTGTLTDNKMTVKKVWVAGNFFNIGGSFNPKQSIELETLVKTGVICNSAEVIKTKEGEWDTLGDPTEASLLILGEKSGYIEKETKDKIDILKEFSFEQKLRRRAVVYEDGGEIFFSAIGSPENILEISSYYMDGGKKVLDDKYKKLIKDTFHSLATNGYRIIALSTKKIEEEREYEREKIGKEMVFIGLVAIYDPPRKGVREAIDKCRAAGIRTVMITGDNELTALSIAREVNLVDGNQKVILGANIEKMSDDELKKAVNNYNIFARTMPSHKLRIVESFQANGKVVAVTGDGVNDAIAIKEADIGIAMGIRGTDVSKEASDMIITDDNFISISKAVEEGRIIYDNIKKFIQFLLTANGIEAPLIIFAIILGIPMPIMPLHILWINFITDSVPAITLGIEPGAKEIMKRKPRPPKKHILKGSGVFIITASFLGFIVSLFLFKKIYDPTLGNLVYAQTIVFTFIVIYKLFLVFSAKSNSETIFELGFFSNKKMVLAVIFSFALQLVVVYWGLLQGVFSTKSISVFSWAYIFILAMALFLLIEFKKVIVRKVKKLNKKLN